MCQVQLLVMKYVLIVQNLKNDNVKQTYEDCMKNWNEKIYQLQCAIPLNRAHKEQPKLDKDGCLILKKK